MYFKLGGTSALILLSLLALTEDDILVVAFLQRLSCSGILTLAAQAFLPLAL